MNISSCLSHLSKGQKFSNGQSEFDGENNQSSGRNTDLFVTPAQVLKTLEYIHNQYINQQLKPSHSSYMLAHKEFMEVAFRDIVQHIEQYAHFSKDPKPLAKILQAISRVANVIIPDNLRITIKNSVCLTDWKIMLLHEFPKQGNNLIQTAKDFDLSQDMLIETLQGGWENAVDGMFDIYVRAEKASNGNMSQFDEYCKNAERFLLRLSATSLSVHSILLIKRKRILQEDTKMTQDKLEKLKKLYIGAAEGTLSRSEKTESTAQVAAFANIPRKGCPALHAKDAEGTSYILVFFRILAGFYKEQFLKSKQK